MPVLVVAVQEVEEGGQVDHGGGDVHPCGLVVGVGVPVVDGGHRQEATRAGEDGLEERSTTTSMWAGRCRRRG